MIRRQARLRREYLYKKSLQEKEKSIEEKKKSIREALSRGSKIPSSLRNETDLLKEITMEGVTSVNLNDNNANMDNEYAKAGTFDPNILITTSRDPSSRLIQFAKEMRLVFPNAQRINRGNFVIKDIVETCKASNVSDLIILHEHRGVPDGLIVSHFPHGPTAYFSLHNVVLRHDLPNQGTVSEANPHLIFNGMDSKIGKRISDILKYLFPVPKEDSKRVMTFSNTSDYISFRHHVFHKKGKSHVELAEVGPRFELRPYEIRLGTADLNDADVEWALRPFMNTAKKRDTLQ